MKEEFSLPFGFTAMLTGYKTLHKAVHKWTSST
jgi:hypothetical protein